MSDGALSQAEIDALLSGAPAGGGAPPPAAGGAGGGNEAKVIEGFLAGTVDTLSSNLSMLTGGSVTFSPPAVKSSDRDTLLNELPETVTAIKIDFTSGFPGEHSFLIPEELAKGIASLMNKEENITLDDVAMSTLGEAVSQISGTEITALSTKTGNKNIASGSPEAANVPKATVALSPNFTVAAYAVNLGGTTHTIWEVFGPQVASGIAAALSPAAPAPNMVNAGMGVPPLSSMGGMVGGPGNVAGSGFGSQPNMQSVQFPSLNNANLPREQGNIGLLMDVFMEMTVELGRTRKLIKEILLMGEGTIIELDKLAGEPVDILVNHKLIAKGEVVVIDENFGVRVTEIVSPAERMPDMG
ncbi:MAG: flagellar motor switch protein FliN [Spirochaetaceae bacterium]|jgi:flagellar motor switch protein FliN/FliY|nr:flagellar motor switch protein FliN [Spirochaetaceae bacterium]